MQRDRAAVAGDDVAPVDHPAHLDLDALDRRIDVARRAPGRRLLAEDVPRLDRLAQLADDAAAGLDRPEEREAELVVRGEPARVEAEAGFAQVVEHVLEVRAGRSAAA